MIKAAFNAMLNSTKPMSRPPSGVNPSKFGLKWSEISDAIKEFHKPIAHHFYTGVGLRLQRIDSDIAERVLLHFASMGRPILPLHDSFMMHYGDEDLLAPVMQHAFEEVVGLSPKIDRKKVSKRICDTLSSFNDGFGPKTASDLMELFTNRSGHDRRLDAFHDLCGRYIRD